MQHAFVQQGIQTCSDEDDFKESRRTLRPSQPSIVRWHGEISREVFSQLLRDCIPKPGRVSYPASRVGTPAKQRQKKSRHCRDG
jgi:hypothetical protein